MIEALGDGLWHWTLRHPDWHPRSDFGAQVGCYAVHQGGGTVLIDPLLEPAIAAELDDVIVGDVVIAITLPYHVRDAATAVKRWGGTVIGHPDVARRLPEGTPFSDEPRLGLRLHAVPRTKERPLELPDARALAFGDRIVGADGGLRFWMQREVTDERRAWYRRVAVPLLEPFLDIDAERVLVTHGPPVLRDGRRALADALAAEPWYHRPS